jgi:hypothetical protein
MVESTGVQKKKKKKKKRKLNHEDGPESSFNIFKPPEVNNDKSEQKPSEKRKIPEAEVLLAVSLLCTVSSLVNGST